MTVYFAVTVGLAAVVVCFPKAAIGAAAAYAFTVLLAVILNRAAGLAFWQVLVLIGLGGYIILNYGFANLAVRVAGVPVIAGHLLMFAALLLAALGNPYRFIKALVEPAALCLVGLMLLTLAHLGSDVAQFGLYAVRDSSIFFEAAFLFLGVAWVRNERDISTLFRWLFALFVINLLYSLTLPWAKSLYSWSPSSGIFQDVAILGHYKESNLYLLGGALFCLWVAQYIVAWPQWSLYLLAVLQMLGLTIHQARSMYVGTAVVLILLLVLQQFRKLAQLSVALCVGLGALVLVGSTTTFELPGRLGPVSPRFLEQHAQSLLLAKGTPGLGTIYHRWEWHKAVWERAGSSTWNLLVGEGFGQPLVTDLRIQTGVIVRQPHNTHLTVLARLGLVGLALWTLFHLSIIARFLRALLLRPRLEPKMRALILWLFLFYVLAMIVTTVQPYLEFSYGAIPFYFIMGVALAVTRGRAEHAPAR
jgi:hypothetical protein